MKPAETKSIYERSCRSRRMEPNQDEAALWHKELRSFESRDVDSALEAWFGSSERDRDGQVKSRFLPSPAELKELTITAERKRKQAAAQPQEYIGYECPGCRYRCGRFVAVGSGAAMVKCGRCGKAMNELKRVQEGVSA